MRSLTLAVVATLALTAVAAKASDRWWEGKKEHTFGPSGHIHGYLVDTADHGLTGLVSLVGADGCRILKMETDSSRQGRFDMDNVPPGRYRLRTESLGLPNGDLAPGDDVEVEVTAHRVIHPHLKARCSK